MAGCRAETPTNSVREEWRAVPSFEGRYEVSDLGGVRPVLASRRNPNREPLSRNHTDRYGYPRVSLYRDGQKFKCRTHQLVAAAFLGPVPDGHEVNHKNGVKGDARLVNIEYVTKRENAQHALRTGLSGKLTVEAVREMRALRASGALLRELSDRFGVPVDTVSRACLGKTWRQAGGPVTRSFARGVA